MLLKWSHTWPEKGTDYLGKDRDRPHAYCRVYKSVANSWGKPWFSTASDGHVDLGSGYAATAREAAEAAEAAY